MAFDTGLSQSQVLSAIQGKLIAHRNALSDITELYKWSSTLAVTDMETAAGLSEADATTILSAIADAAAEATIHDTGQAPSTYPQIVPPATPYIYGASQYQVIGPQ